MSKKTKFREAPAHVGVTPVGQFFVLDERGERSPLLSKEGAMTLAENFFKNTGGCAMVCDASQKGEPVVHTFGTPPALKTEEPAPQPEPSGVVPMPKKKQVREEAKKAIAEHVAQGGKIVQLPAGKASKKPGTKITVAKIVEAATKVVAKAVKDSKPAKVQAKAGKADSTMDRLVEALSAKSGCTTKELAAISGWQNAGWNTILDKLATSRGLKLVKNQTQVAGSNRRVNVWSLRKAS